MGCYRLKYMGACEVYLWKSQIFNIKLKEINYPLASLQRRRKY